VAQLADALPRKNVLGCPEDSSAKTHQIFSLPSLFVVYYHAAGLNLTTGQ